MSSHVSRDRFGISPRYPQWELTRPQVECLLELHFPVLVGKGKVVPANEGGKDNVLLHVSEVLAYTSSGSSTKWNESRFHGFSVTLQPSFRSILIWLRECDRIPVRSICRHGNYGPARNELSRYRRALWRGLSVESGGHRRIYPKRLIKASTQIWELFHFGPRSNKIAVVQGSVELFAQFGQFPRILEQEINGVRQGYRRPIGTGVHYYTSELSAEELCVETYSWHWSRPQSLPCQGSCQPRVYLPIGTQRNRQAPRRSGVSQSSVAQAA